MQKCKLCGRIYQPCGLPFCNDCVRDMDDKFKVVRDYLYDHPDETIEKVAEETEVPEKMIVQFLRDGRVEMKNASGLLRCEMCGAPLKSGRYCAECTRELETRLTKGVKTPVHQAQKSYMQTPEKKTERMYIERKGDR